MESTPKPRPGCFRQLIRAAVWLFVLGIVGVIGISAWDALQLRKLRPPFEQTFEGFVRDGRKGSFLIDAAVERLYWSTWQGTLTVYSEPVVYEFDRSGKLLNWTPGTDNFEGMMLRRPVRRRGEPATMEEARAWMRPR